MAQLNSTVSQEEVISQSKPIQRQEMQTVVLGSDITALQRRGDVSESGSFSETQNSKENESFKAGASEAATYYGLGKALESATSENPLDDTGYHLSAFEKNKLNERAQQVNALTGTDIIIAKSFLYSLLAVDNPIQLQTIFNAVGFASFNASSYMRNPGLLLFMPELYRFGYLSEAVYSILFPISNRYSSAQKAFSNKKKGEIAALQALVLVGNIVTSSFIASQINGSRVSVSTIAQNPNLIPPSYAGKVFFGESPVAYSSIDQPFLRSIARFGTASGGSSTQAFLHQNMGSFSQTISMEDAVSRTLFNENADSLDEYMSSYVRELSQNTNNILGGSENEELSLRHSDNSIPFMLGLSCAISETTNTPFEDYVFTDSWQNASSASTQVTQSNYDYIKTLRETA